MAEADDILARIRQGAPPNPVPTGASAEDVLSRVRTSTPPSPPGTTAGGLLGAVTRGLTPTATGAAAGAALGAPTGIGAIPGAMVGAGAMGLTELVVPLYNRLAGSLGWPKSATPQEMTDRLLDHFGVKRPITGVERETEAITGGAASALGGARGAQAVSDLATSPAVKSIAGKLAERPGLQAVSGAMGGAGAQTAAEAGAGSAGQTVASLLASGVPYTPEALRAAISADPRQGMALQARQAGYVLPPQTFSEKPGIISKALSGWSGQIKTRQAASNKNQEITNNLAHQALGLPPDTFLNDAVFENVRRTASQDYAAIAGSLPVVTANPNYLNTVSQLGGRGRQAAALFPNVTKNPAIDDLVTELQSVTQFPGDVGLEIVRELRFNANQNFRAQGDPSKHQLAFAQRDAADAIDKLIEDNLAASGPGAAGMMDRYRNARQLIAKSYDVEAATNIGNGDVSAHRLAALAAKGRPLTGELETIAKTAAAFPYATQSPSSFGYPQDFSALDFFGAAMAAAHGRPEVAGSILGRPAARAAILSEPYQRTMATPTDATVPLPFLTVPGMSAVTLPPNQYVPGEHPR